MNIEDFENLRYDPSQELTTKNRETVKIDIHTVKRNGRKFTTRVSNLHYHLDTPLKEFLKQCRVEFICGGSVKKEIDKETEEEKEVVQLQGHHREEVKQLLIDKYDIFESDIVERGA